MIVVGLLYLNAVTVATTDPQYILREGPQYFNEFIEKHNKSYASDVEKYTRYQVFLQNLEEINKLNANNEYAEFGINPYGDFTVDEFLSKHTCFKEPTDRENNCRYVTQRMYHNGELPSEFDWRNKNAVTRVKSQGDCGSCWAFSTIGNVESINAIKTGQVVELSEQQLIDCDKGDFGCDGGYPDRALRYLMQTGAMSSASYPYKATGSNCRYDPLGVVARVTDCIAVSGDEDLIAEQLVNVGPLSIAIDASMLQFYKKGILTGGSCQGEKLNHAVLLVGYGVENGTRYWIVKNSWGEGIKEEGYFRMQRGVNCLKFLSYPPVSAVLG